MGLRTHWLKGSSGWTFNEFLSQSDCRIRDSVLASTMNVLVFPFFHTGDYEEALPILNILLGSNKYNAVSLTAVPIQWKERNIGQ